VLLEGKNHEVRRLFASVGAEVRRLKRVRYGPVVLPSWLRRGQRFELNNDDVTALYKMLGMTVQPPAERPSRRGDRRGLVDRSVLIPYPQLPGVAAAPLADQAKPAKKSIQSGSKNAQQNVANSAGKSGGKRAQKKSVNKRAHPVAGKSGAKKSAQSGRKKDWRKR